MIYYIYHWKTSMDFSIYCKASAEAVLSDWPNAIYPDSVSAELHPPSITRLYQIQLLIMKVKTQLSWIALSVNLHPCLPAWLIGWFV